MIVGLGGWLLIPLISLRHFDVALPEAYSWGWVGVVYVSIFFFGSLDYRRGQTLQVVEQYRDWEPPISLVPVVQSLLFTLPPRYLLGLKTVVLTNASGLNRTRRRSKTRSRQRKVKVVDVLGLYHPARRENPPWIELFIDNIFKSEPDTVYRIPYWRDWILMHTLYHELGHHIHAYQAPEFRDKEDIAEDWAETLAAKQYRRLHAIAQECGYISRSIIKLARWYSRKEKEHRHAHRDSSHA
jgi:hypothetical protein